MEKKDIPLVNLSAQYAELRESILSTLDDVCKKGAFIQGAFVEKFEGEFAALQGVKHVIGCSNGTSAIALALEALGIGKGDEVITTPFTFIATAEAIYHVGAVPVFVDIDLSTYNIDPSRISEAVTRKTKAILPVHLYGRPADMNPIMEIARSRDLKVIEDCAQAHLATYEGKPVGSIGDASTFSFFPGKNLGAYGDAGCIVTNNEKVAATVRKLRDHGRTDKYRHDVIGYNHRMDGFQGAVLSVKQAHLRKWTENRRRIASLYGEMLGDLNWLQVEQAPLEGHVYHLFVLRLKGRGSLASHLKDHGIASGVHYPIPLHLQPAFNGLGYKLGAMPNSEEAAESVLSLPICGSLKEEDAVRVCEIVRSFRN